MSALLFLCREVLAIPIEGLELTARAKRGTHLPVVLSMPETAALLDAMKGAARLMATLIHGGGLRVSDPDAIERKYPRAGTELGWRLAHT